MTFDTTGLYYLTASAFFSLLHTTFVQQLKKIVTVLFISSRTRFLSETVSNFFLFEHEDKRTNHGE
jgi:hypothetical protein